MVVSTCEPSNAFLFPFAKVAVTTTKVRILRISVLPVSPVWILLYGNLLGEMFWVTDTQYLSSLASPRLATTHTTQERIGKHTALDCSIAPLLPPDMHVDRLLFLLNTPLLFYLISLRGPIN